MTLPEIEIETHKSYLWAKLFRSCIITVDAACYLWKVGEAQIFFLTRFLHCERPSFLETY